VGGYTVRRQAALVGGFGIASVLLGFGNLALAAWAGRRPLRAFCVALVLFATDTLALAICVGPRALLSEARLVGFVVLVLGCVAAQKAERMRTRCGLGLDAGA